MDVDPHANIWAKKDRPENAPQNHLTYTEFLRAVEKVAPAALERSCTLRRSATRADIISAQRYNRTLLRRIFMKFLVMQPTAKAGTEHEDLLEWPLFISFVQTGGAAAMSNLEKA